MTPENYEKLSEDCSCHCHDEVPGLQCRCIKICKHCEPIVTTKPPEDQKPEEKAIIDRNSSEPQAWEEEFDKFVDKNYEEKFGLNSTFKLVWGCEECNGEDAESDIKDFIRTLRQKDKERLMAGMEKLWNKKTSLTQSTLPDGRIEYKQSAPYNVTEASLEDFKQLLNQIYE